MGLAPNYIMGNGDRDPKLGLGSVPEPPLPSSLGSLATQGLPCL